MDPGKNGFRRSALERSPRFWLLLLSAAVWVTIFSPPGGLAAELLQIDGQTQQVAVTDGRQTRVYHYRHGVSVTLNGANSNTKQLTPGMELTIISHEPGIANRIVATDGLQRRREASPLAAPLDLNKASAKELQMLPGIGPEKATAILRQRPFRTIDDLAKVKGIGAQTLEKLRPYVTLGR